MGIDATILFKTYMTKEEIKREIVLEDYITVRDVDPKYSKHGETHEIDSPFRYYGKNYARANDSRVTGPHDTSPLLTSRMGTGGGNVPLTTFPRYTLRRLFPVECERLQGFPDNYTNIPWKKSMESPDGLRYKAIGNSWAVPCVRWIFKRLLKSLERVAP